MESDWVCIARISLEKKRKGRFNRISYRKFSFRASVTRDFYCFRFVLQHFFIFEFTDAVRNLQSPLLFFMQWAKSGLVSRGVLSDTRIIYVFLQHSDLIDGYQHTICVDCHFIHLYNLIVQLYTITYYTIILLDL